jgi:hypothetical protein
LACQLLQFLPLAIGQT